MLYNFPYSLNFFSVDSNIVLSLRTIIFKYSIDSMKILQTLASVVALAAVAVSCQNEVESTTPVTPNVESEVSFAMPIDVTRTTLDPDGYSTRWSPGDEVAMWAVDAEGNTVFENSVFMLRYFSLEWDKAYFSGNVAPMADGNYTYYLSYPKPVSAEGTMATYRVSAEQSGEYDGKHDIMVAEPTINGSLTAEKRVELNTTMRHQMHAIKITIPEGRNLFGMKFYELEITFPQDVVGDITLDVTNPEAVPTYTNTSNVIKVKNEKGFDAGDDIWVFVLPGTIDGDVSYKVRGEHRSSEVASYPLTRTMQAGHVTPIRMATPEIYPYYTAVIFSISQNNLGEEFNFFDIYDANNTHMGRFERNAENKYVVDYEGEFDANIYDNSTWRVVFDSENAIVETQVNLGDITSYTEQTRYMNVPYLFAENFSSLAQFDGDYTGGPYTSTSAASTAGRDLAQYGIASGWTGARTGCDAAGTAILVSGRVDCVIAGATRAYGRLDSPALTGIKSNKSVNVKVVFDYGGSRSGNSTYYPVGRVGYTTDAGILNGYATQFNNNAAFTNISAEVEVPSIPTSGSASSLSKSMTYTISNCTSSHRISWHVGHLGYKSWKINNGYGWMYIDNIKVQIIK